MKKPFQFIFFSIFFSCFCMSQDKTKPIVFGEIIIGYSNGSSKGFTSGATLNYQNNNNLFTYRHLEVIDYKKQGNFYFLPIYTEVEAIKEQALLYGKRIIEDDVSYSYSAGISYVNRDYLVDSSNNVLKYQNTQSIGFPFEINVKWFNSKKEKYRIYEIIPIGKPTGFNNSIGFKIYGDVSKTSFFGLGVTFGLGWHKNY